MREKDKEGCDSIFPNWQLVPNHFTAPNLGVVPYHSHQNTKTRVP